MEKDMNLVYKQIFQTLDSIKGHLRSIDTKLDNMIEKTSQLKSKESESK